MVPAHAEFRNEHIGVIAQEFFKADCGRKFQGIETRRAKSWTENWEVSFGVERISLPARIREESGPSSKNVA